MGLCLPPAVILVGLLRYAHLLERLGPSLLNTLGLATGWICAAGLTMVGNFQVRRLLGEFLGEEGLGWSGEITLLNSVGCGVIVLFQQPHPCTLSPLTSTALPWVLGVLFACV